MPQEGLPEFPEQIGYTAPPISDKQRRFSLDYLLSKRHKRFPRKLKKKIKKKSEKHFGRKVIFFLNCFGNATLRTKDGGDL
jgi:hypothetical protein